MQNPPKTFSDIPPEIVGEFVSHVDAKRDLEHMSLVCCKLRNPSQRKLFTRVWVDPTLDLERTICDVVKEPYTHLALHIKQIQVVKFFRPRGDPNPPRCSPKFLLFLRSLPSPEAMDIMYPDFDWADIPKDTVNTFLGVLSLPSFRTLEVSYGKNFPLSPFLHKTNTATLKMIDTNNLALLPDVDSSGSLETRLTSLILSGPDTITAFAASLRANSTFAQNICQNLTQLWLRYVESPILSPISMDTTMEILSTVGSSLTSLRAEVSCELLVYIHDSIFLPLTDCHFLQSLNLPNP